IPQPEAASGYSFEEVREVAARIGYPVLVRPSYVLGGRGMEIVHGEEDLAEFMERAVRVSKTHPVLVDRYLSHATELDVDVVAEGKDRPLRGESPGVPVPAPPRRGHDSRPGNEEHRRGHGNRSVARPRVLQGDARRRESAADPGGGLRDRPRRRQADDPPRGRAARADWPSDLCDARHGAIPPGA